MKRFTSFLVACLWMVSAVPVSAAVQKSEGFVPFVPTENEFASAIVMTAGTHKVLYGFKPEQPRVAASLTKLPNALALVSQKPRWGRIISITKADEVGGGRLRVPNGSTISVQDALYSSITASANNTATALARTHGGTKAFLKKMNAEAVRVGAKRSAFYDASGMDPRNMTTARDIALIAEAAFANPVVRRAAQTGTYRFAIQNTGDAKTIRNTNDLLADTHKVWVIGGKTGYLEESQYNLVVHVRAMDAEGKPVYGRDLLVAVLGSPTKKGSFFTAERLAQWAWNNHAF